MFHGPYMITQVNHTISPGNFETVIEGIRQPTASVLKIDNYIQTLKVNLLSSILSKTKTNLEESNKSKAENKVNTNQENQNDAKKAGNDNKQIDDSNQCVGLLEETFKKFTPIDTPAESTVTPKELADRIISRFTTKGIVDDGKLKYAIFYSFYQVSYSNDKFISFENNFTGIDLTKKWTNISNPNFFCLSSSNSPTYKKTVPYAKFSSLNEIIDLLIDRYGQRMVNVKTDKLAEEIAKFWILNREPNIPVSTYETMIAADRESFKVSAEKSIKLFNTLTGNYVVTPAPLPPDPLIKEYKYSPSTPPLFESLKITINPKIDGPREIFSVKYDYETDAKCAAGRGTGQQFNTNLISSNKQEVFIEFIDLLTDLECNNVPSNESKGTYKFQITIYTSPVKADGSKDNTRTDYYKSYPITFTL